MEPLNHLGSLAIVSNLVEKKQDLLKFVCNKPQQ